MINDLKQRAYEQERSENFGRAIELYESVIDHRETEGLTHQDASVFLRIADLHLRRDQDGEAIEAFQRAGELYAREGLQPQAIAVYRRILRFAPGHTEALWNLAWLHAEMGVMAEARQYVTDYLDTVDMERDWVEATDFLRRLLDLSEDVAIGLRLAELLEEGDRHEEAHEVLERLDVDFGAPSALDQEEIRARIEALREQVEPGLEEREAEAEPSFVDGEPEDFGDTLPDFEGTDDLEGAEELDEAGDLGDTGGVEGPSPGLEAPASRLDESPSELGGDEFGEGELGKDEPEDRAPEADEDIDLDVGPDESGSLDDGFPFPDGDEEIENGAFDDEAGEFPAPSAPSELDEPEGSEQEPDVSEQEPDVLEQEEEQMSSESQDLPGGPAVEKGEDEDPGPRQGAAGFGGPPSGVGSREAGGPSRAEEYEEYGERTELRRGLDVLDELIELDPDRLDHYRRRVGYAERLDDDGELVESYLRLANTLGRRGSSRGARLVYEHVLSFAPEAERARAGIEELSRDAREELDVPEPFPDAGVEAPSDPGADGSELARRVWPELDRALGQVQWLQGAARHLRDGEESGWADGPPAAAYELAGRYFLSRGDVEGAIDTLSLALDREDLGDSELMGVLFQLGLSHYRIDDRGSARKYFDRVASHDEDFDAVYGWVLSES